MKLVLLSLLLFPLLISGQIDSTKSSTHIFWNAEYPIEMKHFQDTIGNESFRNKCDSIGLCWGAFVGLFTIIDEPKKKKKRGELLEKAYFAPAFEIARSYRFNNDSSDFLTQLLVFDVYELAARKCRQDLEKLFIQMPYYGTKIIMFKEIEVANKKLVQEIVWSITNDIYILKKENAYKEWRKTTDDLLKETEQYKTTNEDRARFILDSPILKNYQMAKTESVENNV